MLALPRGFDVWCMMISDEGKEIRVAMLSQRYLPFTGGAEKQLAAVLRRLPAFGIEAMVLTRRHDESPAKEIVDGTTVHRIEVGGPRAFASLSYTAQALMKLRRFRPHVVHALELLSPSTTALAYRAMTDVPVVAKVLRGGSLGDIAVLEQSRSGRLRLPALLRKIDAFAVISREIDDELAAKGVSPARRHFIPNGVDLSHYQPVEIEEKRRIRARLGLPDQPIALFAGRLETEKRIDRLISLWPNVCQRIPDATLVVAGTGSLETTLVAAGIKGTLLIGEQSDLRDWYAASDVFVLPSLAEGLSNAMLEAMSMALPCIATRVGAAAELLADGTGQLVDLHDDDALVAALISVLACPEHFSGGARRARRRVTEEFSIDATVSRLVCLYKALAGAPSSE